MNKYSLSFEGTIGEFVKLIRKSKKINSKDLSLSIGKSESYCSHLENGRNKNPDYQLMYLIFQKIGIEEKKIEDYLYYFGIYSPDRLAHEEELMASKINPSNEDIENMEKEAEHFAGLEREKFLQQEKEAHERSGDDLLQGILEDDLKEIEKVIKNIMNHDLSGSYGLIKGLHDSFNSIGTNKVLYQFIIKFFSEKVSTLDNEGLTKVINTLYEELNRVDRENAAFGKPKQRSLIDKL